MRFEGKVVMVTGAGAGLGHATALKLAQEGAHLALIDVNLDALEESKTTIVAAVPTVDVLTLTADVSSEPDVAAYVAETHKHFGHIDGLYNNAGIEGKQDPVDAYDSEMFDRVIDINLKGVFYGMKHTLPYLKGQSSGAIVNAASVGGIRAVPNQVAYGASKHAVAGMTKDAAIEYGQYGVNINAIAPGAIMTAMIKGALVQLAGEERWQEAGEEFVSVNPMKRFGQPHEVANLVAFLLSDEASFINGAIVPIDGGQSQAY